MSAQIFFVDFDKKSRQPDAEAPRNPVDADVIILPVIHRFPRDELPSVFLPDNDLFEVSS